MNTYEWTTKAKVDGRYQVERSKIYCGSSGDVQGWVDGVDSVLTTTMGEYWLNTTWNGLHNNYCQVTTYSVSTVDNATYHHKKEQQTPTTANEKMTSNNGWTNKIYNMLTQT